VLILDGTLIVSDRLPDRDYYSGKHSHCRVNVQQVTDGRGNPLWSSPGVPGGTHDLTAIRATGPLTARGVVVLADKRSQASGTVC